LRLQAAENPCAVCHPNEVKTLSRDAMAQSVGTVAPQPEGRVRHQPSDSEIAIRRSAGGTMVHRLSSRGLTAEYPVAYAVGAGKANAATVPRGRIFRSQFRAQS
jgi:hypothetical protein